MLVCSLGGVKEIANLRKVPNAKTLAVCMETDCRMSGGKVSEEPVSHSFVVKCNDIIVQ